jgi:type II secretory ATPase GspE/PulE/Tfp pilus assembly ATPase PilB-like protein
MSAVLGTQQNTGMLDDVNKRLEFFKRLQSVTNKIHSANDVDEIMLDLSQDICDLFNCDRLTIYALSDDRQTIVSKVKTGLNTAKELRLPLTEQSIAGYVAVSKRIVNLRDVYDENELKALSPNLHFLAEVDRRTGYRTRQMLVAPIVDEHSRDLLGVVQLINHREGGPFTSVNEDGIKQLCATLAIAFMMRQRPLSIIRSKYEHLVKESVLSAAELEVATSTARRKGEEIESILSTEFHVALPTIGSALSKFFGVPYEPHKPDRIRPANLLKNLKRDYAEQNQWLPIEENGDGIVIMATDPEQVRSARIITSIFPKTRLFYCVTTRREFRDTLDDFFGAEADAGTVDELLQGMAEESEAEEGEAPVDDVAAAAESELVKLVNKMITDAYNMGVSDIHIEPRPGKEKIGIRFRRDGSLEPYIEIPATYRAALIARIKIMCDLDISERRKPQDGKIKFKRFAPLDIELRVATIPSAGGVEDVVMRILAAGEPIPLDKLGVLPHNLERLKNVVSKPYGLFFVCGPTGSGKTTTLHSVLNFLNTPDTKIWTAEDPVEITQKGLRQVQVNRKAGLDFATVMRAFLRADPDVIMVGEMRDKETVSIGLEASLTGHLVFATLHTNSAPESIVRLLDMGMDPFNFADALLGVLAQRLSKRLCSNCKEAYEPTPEEVQMLMREYTEELQFTPGFSKDPKAATQAIFERWKKDYGDAQGKLKLYKPVGCNACNNTGYKGRVGLHELMVGSDALKKLIQEHARVAEMLRCALDDGMLTLKMDGIEKVLSGVTDMKQVRVVCIK